MGPQQKHKKQNDTMTARDNLTMTPDLITCSAGVDVFGLWERVLGLIYHRARKSQQSLMFFLSPPHAISSADSTSIPH